MSWVCRFSERNGHPTHPFFLSFNRRTLKLYQCPIVQFSTDDRSWRPKTHWVSSRYQRSANVVKWIMRSDCYTWSNISEDYEISYYGLTTWNLIMLFSFLFHFATVIYRAGEKQRPTSLYEVLEKTSPWCHNSNLVHTSQKISFAFTSEYSPERADTLYYFFSSSKSIEQDKNYG